MPFPLSLLAVIEQEKSQSEWWRHRLCTVQSTSLAFCPHPVSLNKTCTDSPNHCTTSPLLPFIKWNGKCHLSCMVLSYAAPVVSWSGDGKQDCNLTAGELLVCMWCICFVCLLWMHKFYMQIKKVKYDLCKSLLHLDGTTAYRVLIASVNLIGLFWYEFRVICFWTYWNNCPVASEILNLNCTKQLMAKLMVKLALGNLRLQWKNKAMRHKLACLTRN